MRKDTLFWEDVQVGQEMTPAEVKITYAMMIAGLGLMGFVARRRKQNAAA